jgi:hypothetical protein
MGEPAVIIVEKLKLDIGQADYTMIGSKGQQCAVFSLAHFFNIGLICYCHYCDDEV